MSTFRFKDDTKFVTYNSIDDLPKVLTALLPTDTYVRLCDDNSLEVVKDMCWGIEEEAVVPIGSTLAVLGYCHLHVEPRELGPDTRYEFETWSPGRPDTTGDLGFMVVEC